MVNVIITKRISFVKLVDKKWSYTAKQAKKASFLLCRDKGCHASTSS